MDETENPDAQLPSPQDSEARRIKGDARFKKMGDAMVDNLNRAREEWLKKQQQQEAQSTGSAEPARENLR